MNTLGMGLLISTFSETQQQAMMTTFLFFFPMMLLSGFVFPIANMPEAVQWLTIVNPIRYFMVIVRSIFLKGVGLERSVDRDAPAAANGRGPAFLRRAAVPQDAVASGGTSLSPRRRAWFPAGGRQSGTPGASREGPGPAPPPPRPSLQAQGVPPDSTAGRGALRNLTFLSYDTIIREVVRLTATAREQSRPRPSLRRSRGRTSRRPGWHV